MYCNTYVVDSTVQLSPPVTCTLVPGQWVLKKMYILERGGGVHRPNMEVFTPRKICNCVFYENWLRSSDGQIMRIQGVHYISQLEFFNYAVAKDFQYWKCTRPKFPGYAI